VKREYVELWERTLVAIAPRVREASFEGWFKTARLVEIEPDGTAVIESQVELGPVWMEENYSRMLLEVIGGMREGVGRLRFVRGAGE
jgi:chromosomal replication initiation ATPase DnaA